MGLTESKNLLREKLFGFSMNASALTKDIEKKNHHIHLQTVTITDPQPPPATAVEVTLNISLPVCS